MIATRFSMICLAALAGGCASGDSLEGQRTVFDNPHAPLVVDRTGIGPQCDIDLGRDATCLGGPLIYPGRGRHASLGNGESVRLTRDQARILRERAELLEALRKLPLPLPPPPPVLPTAATDGDKP
jgi:hypothetical protein